MHRGVPQFGHTQIVLIRRDICTGIIHSVQMNGHGPDKRAECRALLQQVLADHHTLHLVGAFVDLGEVGDSSARPIASTTRVLTPAQSVSCRDASLICRDEVGTSSSFSFDPLTRPAPGECIWPPIGGIRER